MPLSQAPLQLSCRPLQILEGCLKVTPEPSLLQAEQPQLPQPFLTSEGFQPLNIFVALYWPHTNRSRSVLCWELQSWMQDSRGGLTKAEQSILWCPWKKINLTEFKNHWLLFEVWFLLAIGLSGVTIFILQLREVMDLNSFTPLVKCMSVQIRIEH